MDDKEQRSIIIQIYAAFVIVILAHLYPVGIVGLIAVTVVIAVLIAAYYYKAKAEENSLMENHMIYVIRTFWIGSLYMMIFITIAALYMAPNLDVTILEGIRDGTITPYSIEEVKALEKRFMVDNSTIIWNGILIAFGPTFLFFAYRCLNGLVRSVKGYRIGNFRSWF